MNTHQRYLIEEFAEEYLERRLNRRDLLKRVLLITGSVAVTANVLTTLGCGSSSSPAATATGAAAASPTALPPTPPPPSGPGVTVQPDDAAIQAAEVRFKGPASEIIAYLSRPKGTGPFPGVIVIHENRGLVEHIKDVTRRYAKEGFVALAVDLVSRRGGSAAGDANTIPGFLGSAPPEDLISDLLAGVDYLKGQSFVRATALGVIGFCFGGTTPGSCLPPART